MVSFKEWLLLETNSSYVYHVTLAKNLPGIFSSRLIPRGGHSLWTANSLKNHSKKGVFVCRDIECARHWYKIMSLGKLDQDPVILRFKLNRNRLRKDINTTIPGSYYSVKDINPIGIQFWNGYKWTSDLHDIENAKYSAAIS